MRRSNAGRTRVRPSVSRLRPSRAHLEPAASLLLHSFNLYRLGPLNDFPVTATAQSQSTYIALSKALKLFLERQLSLDAALGSQPFTRVQAGYINCVPHGPSHPNLVPFLIEVDRATEEGSATTSTFVLLPPSPSDPSSFPILLARSSPTALTTTFSNFLSTRYDTLVTPLRIPPPAMLDLLQSLTSTRDPDSANPTSVTFAFPPTIAREGLSSLTLTLPPPLLDALSPVDAADDDPPPRPFLESLSEYFHSLTSLKLVDMQLVRMGGGRGTFVHSGYGAGGGGGGETAKVKFYSKAGDDGELERTLELLIKVAEAGR